MITYSKRWRTIDWSSCSSESARKPRCHCYGPRNHSSRYNESICTAIRVGKGEVCIRAKWLIRPELILVSEAWSDWEYFYSPLDEMLVHCRVTLSFKFTGTHLYTWGHWVQRGTVRVKCLAQERYAMTPASARTRTARSGVERTNHETTAPPHLTVEKHLNVHTANHSCCKNPARYLFVWRW